MNYLNPALNDAVVRDRLAAREEAARNWRRAGAASRHKVPLRVRAGRARLSLTARLTIWKSRVATGLRKGSRAAELSDSDAA